MRPLYFRFLLFAGAVLFHLSAGAQQVPAFQWAVQAGSLYNLGTLAPNGNSYVVSSNGVECYSARGVLRRTFPVSSFWGGYFTIRTDSVGNVYGATNFSDSITIGTTHLTASGNRINVVVCKWDSTGAIQWIQQGQNKAGITRLAVDRQGNVTVAGMYDQTLSFGTTVIPASGAYNAIFCLRFDPQGNVRWARWSSNQTNTIYLSDMTVDWASGAVYLITADVISSFSWAGRTMSNGACHWLKLSGQTGLVLHEFPYPNEANSGHVCTASDGYSYFGDVIVRHRPDTTIAFSNTTIRLPALTIGSLSGFTGILARLDPDGVPQWIKVFNEDTNGGFNLKSLWADSRGNTTNTRLYVTGSYSARQPFSFFNVSPPLPVTAGIAPYHSGDGYVASFDALTGDIQWALPAATGQSAAGVTCIEVTDHDDLMIWGGAEGSSARFGSVLLNFPGQPSTTTKPFMAKLVQRYNQITGAVYVDYDTTNTLSPGDRVFENCIVQTHPEDFFFATDTAGRYGTVITRMGANTVTLPEVPIYHTLPPTPPAPASFSTFGNVAPGRDFKLQPVPNQQDVQAFLTPLTEDVVPGNPVQYQVLCRNVGTTTTNANLTLALDPRLDYQSNSGGATYSGTSLSLAYLNMRPGEKRTFTVDCLLPATVPGGTSIASTVTATASTTDLTPADNTETARQEVLTIVDPFGFRVSHTALTSGQVAAGEWLDYTIYFDNQGSDTVSSVMLRDSLPTAQFRMGSLDLITASHPCTWRLNPTGVLTATLTGARLTPRSRDARHSAGFARFRVRVAPTLQLGDVVLNRARVHFDARPPVTTPTAVTLIQIITGLPTAANEAAAQVWPNPASGTLHIALATAESTTLTLLDALGRPVLTQAVATPEATLDVRHLPAGVYVLRGQQGGQAFTRRVVLR